MYTPTEKLLDPADDHCGSVPQHTVCEGYHDDDDDDGEDDEVEEELADLPVAVMLADRHFRQWILCVVNGVPIVGLVEFIEVGILSCVTAYRIRYEGGGTEHLSNRQVDEGKRAYDANT